MLSRSRRHLADCSDLAPRSCIRCYPERSAFHQTAAGKTTVNPRNFFAELKRRNVYKVAVAYAVVAWLLIQAASILFPTFEAPAWVMKVVVAAIALGFPVALILAWAFELTPEGIKRADEVAPDESIAPRTGRKLLAMTIALAGVAACLLAESLSLATEWKPTSRKR